MDNEEIFDRHNEEEEKSTADSPQPIKKSLSTIGFRNNTENQNARPMALRSTQSFTGTFQELRFCNNFQKLNVNPMNEAATPRLAAVCPCGCLLRPATLVPFRTRERNTLALHIVQPDVLSYHGYNFDPCQIAMFWKKDCRMFLWKGITKKTWNDVNVN